MDIEQFLEGVARKDNKAWEELYRYFYAPLCGYAARIVDDSSAADEGAARRTAALYVRDFTSDELKDMFGGRR